jgi:xanthine dehydrogenase accessory factor
MMAAWLDALRTLERDDTPSVLVTLLAVRGSTPREAGCKMVVTSAATHGTIGGGNLEYVTIALAREVLASGASAPLTREFPLGPELGQCCGGHASVLLEPMRPTAFQVALFGAGHVGRALVTVLSTLDCRVRWSDSRADAFPAEIPPNVVTHVEGTGIEKLRADTFVLVMTHDHALDFDLVAAALARRDLPYVGLIGSETKRARFVARLRRAGVGEDAIRRLVCPIGVDGAGGKAPAEIAVAVAAQLLQTRDALAAFAPAPRPVSQGVAR